MFKYVALQNKLTLPVPGRYQYIAIRSIDQLIIRTVISCMNIQIIFQIKVSIAFYIIRNQNWAFLLLKKIQDFEEFLILGIQFHLFL